MISGTPARRLGALALTATALLAACTSDDDDDDSGGDDMTELRWDLSTPTTTRELGSDSDEVLNARAPRGELLDVEIELPGLTYRGAYDMVTAAPTRVELSDAALPVADLTLYDVDVDSVDGLRPILQRFERDWGFTAEDCEQVGAFLADAESRMAAAGGDPMQVDWGLTQAVSFAGEPRNGVEPGIVVRVPPTAFSTFTLLKWDPDAEFDGERATVGTPDAPAPADEATPCTS